MTEERIEGIFHEQKQISAGTMGTARVHDAAHELHYFCKSSDDGSEVILFYLKPDGKATSIEMERVDAADFATRFKPTAPERFAPKTKEDRAREEAEKKVSVAEKHIEKEEYNAAAFEYGQAIKHDKSNLKAHLGKGKAHMELGETDKAQEAFAGLSKIDNLYEKENKHLFNEYGIELRRGAMYDMAIENYQKAIGIDPEDEALYFNVARAHQEKGNVAEAKAALEKAIALKSDFAEAKMLLAALTKKG